MNQVKLGKPTKNQSETVVINIYALNLQKQENNVKMIVYADASFADFTITNNVIIP
jgi:hypothetical protein